MYFPDTRQHRADIEDYLYPKPLSGVKETGQAPKN